MRKGRMPRLACGPFLCLALLSCSDGTTPTSDQQQQLDNAADSLNQAAAEIESIDLNALDAPPAEAPAP